MIVRVRFKGKEKLVELLAKLENSGKTKCVFMGFI